MRTYDITYSSTIRLTANNKTEAENLAEQIMFNELNQANSINKHFIVKTKVVKKK